MPSLFGPQPKDKNKSDDRVIELKVIDAKKPLSSMGMTDHRLFSGENKLHAVRDPHFLWQLKYEQGYLPAALQQKFTHFDKLVTTVKEYFGTRNVEVVKIND